MAHKWHLEDRCEDDCYCYPLCLIRVCDDGVITLRAQEQDAALQGDRDFLMRRKQIYICPLKKHMVKRLV